MAALTVQMAIAAPRSPRKAARTVSAVNHSIRDAFGSAPTGVVSKSCDRFWYYQD